jgi:hypothetical protein
LTIESDFASDSIVDLSPMSNILPADESVYAIMREKLGLGAFYCEIVFVLISICLRQNLSTKNVGHDFIIDLSEDEELS